MDKVDILIIIYFLLYLQNPRFYEKQNEIIII